MEYNQKTKENPQNPQTPKESWMCNRQGIMTCLTNQQCKAVWGKGGTTLILAEVNRKQLLCSAQH